MKKGITSDGKWKWWGFGDKIYILKRRNTFAEELEGVDPLYWRSLE